MEAKGPFTGLKNDKHRRLKRQCCMVALFKKKEDQNGTVVKIRSVY